MTLSCSHGYLLFIWRGLNHLKVVICLLNLFQYLFGCWMFLKRLTGLRCEFISGSLQCIGLEYKNVFGTVTGRIMSWLGAYLYFLSMDPVKDSDVVIVPGFPGYWLLSICVLVPLLLTYLWNIKCCQNNITFLVFFLNFSREKKCFQV